MNATRNSDKMAPINVFGKIMIIMELTSLEPDAED